MADQQKSRWTWEVPGFEPRKSVEVPGSRFQAAKLQQIEPDALNDLEPCVDQAIEDNKRVLPLIASRVKASFSIN